MIIGKLHEVEKQVNQSQNIVFALDYLKKVNPVEISDGQYFVKDKEVFAIIQEFTTENLTNDVEVEGHRKFIDVYYVISGCEKIGWTSVDPIDNLIDYDEENDVWKKVVKSSELNYFAIGKGDVAILFPSDAHASQINMKGSIKARKIIMKVAVEEY